MVKAAAPPPPRAAVLGPAGRGTRLAWPDEFGGSAGLGVRGPRALPLLKPPRGRVPLLTHHQDLPSPPRSRLPNRRGSGHWTLGATPGLTARDHAERTRPRSRPSRAGAPARTHRSGLLAGWVAGQRHEIFERVLRVEVRRVADGRVWEVGGGRLRQDGGRGEVQGGGRVGAPGDPCGEGAGGHRVRRPARAAGPGLAFRTPDWGLSGKTLQAPASSPLLKTF